MCPFLLNYCLNSLLMRVTNFTFYLTQYFCFILLSSKLFTHSTTGDASEEKNNKPAAINQLPLHHMEKQFQTITFLNQTVCKKNLHFYYITSVKIRLNHLSIKGVFLSFFLYFGNTNQQNFILFECNCSYNSKITVLHHL